MPPPFIPLHRNRREAQHISRPSHSEFPSFLNSFIAIPMLTLKLLQTVSHQRNKTRILCKWFKSLPKGIQLKKYVSSMLDWGLLSAMAHHWVQRQNLWLQMSFTHDELSTCIKMCWSVVGNSGELGSSMLENFGIWREIVPFSRPTSKYICILNLKLVACWEIKIFQNEQIVNLLLINMIGVLPF